MDPMCHNCNSHNFCILGKPNDNIDNCPMIYSSDIEKEALNLYKTDDFIKKATKEASIVEATGYLIWPRLKDTIEFARGMGFKKIGLALCVGLLREAKKIADILNKYGFEVSSVCCKTGSIAKTEVGVPKEYTILSKTGHPLGFVSCNPVAQALLLNKAKTDLNLIIGLCVGHDITFTHLSKAPVSTLIAKDRSHPHNPAAVLYTSYGDSYFEKDLEVLQKNQK
ncbi:MAG: DUF1847 domain-containing protein [Promethearchaeota archaeon]